MNKLFKILLVFGLISAFLVENFTRVSAKEVMDEGFQIIEVESPERIINTRSASETIVSKDKTTYYIKNSDMTLLRSRDSTIKIANLASATVKITNTYLVKTVQNIDCYKLQSVQYYYSTKTSQYVFENVVARTRAIGARDDSQVNNFSTDNTLGNIGTYYTYTKAVSSGYIYDMAGVPATIVGGQTTWTLRDRSFNNTTDGLLSNSLVVWTGY